MCCGEEDDLAIGGSRCGDREALARPGRGGLGGAPETEGERERLAAAAGPPVVANATLSGLGGDGAGCAPLLSRPNAPSVRFSCGDRLCTPNRATSKAVGCTRPMGTPDWCMRMCWK